MAKPAHIAVIGAGWAGCAAAVTLVQSGHQVTLLEASRTLGGRARRVSLDDRTLDNGQHILLGAYKATLKMLKTVGVDTKTALLRLPLQMRYPAGCDGMDFVAPRLPAPWHVLVALLRAGGLSGQDKMSLARFSSTARWMGWQLNDDCSVAELLNRFDQTDRLQGLLWYPLCIAALNTPPERASAQIFLNVLRDSLGARRAASDMLLPRVNLSALLPEPAAAFVQRNGGVVETAHAVRSLRHSPQADRGWELSLRHTQAAQSFDGIVLATGPEAAAELLGEISESGDGSNIDLLRQMTHEAISTCYLQYDPTLRLAAPFYALRDDPQQHCWGQFVFDRAQLSDDPRDAGLLAVIVSAADLAIELGHTALAARITAQLAQQLQNPQLQSPRWSKVVSEKRATFSCTPGLRRPDNSSLPQGLALAGDYVAGNYPATLEGAVLSGIAAAQRITQSL
ncbi:squalene-associated FAD-dependent desaturase [Herbaspirillum sp. Sphag1AN]|uniref:hydroxysqualene dehydroxylase HpnE n=1 Tax=unclassified Herbaspirillum TaxID=2624150 RepID=UPI001611CD7F|nr:squalene-associated FAD-dependent desaturase [Herbaspirillum sp. Sphag1AN]MBB3244162.1 squalene-associated FAD-dependent desaturase [Herbaspirillum sp. Sphag64]